MHARFSWVWVLLLSSVPLLFSQAGSHPPVLRVDEHKIQLSNGSPSRLELPVFNGTRQVVTARVRVELLRPDGNIVADQELESSIAAGDHFVSLQWPGNEPLPPGEIRRGSIFR